MNVLLVGRVTPCAPLEAVGSGVGARSDALYRTARGECVGSGSHFSEDDTSRIGPSKPEGMGRI